MDATAGVVQNPGHMRKETLFAAIALLAMVAATVRAVLAHTGGRLVYPLDDAYIHMAVARNLAEHGVWGVTRHGFTSSTSSLAWPLLLAAFDRIVGAAAWLPLSLNVAAGLACLAVAAALLPPHPPWARLGVLAAIVFLTPLPTLVVSGMEHTLHVCAALAFAGLVARAVDADDGRPRPGTMALAATAALAASLRYESLFLVAAAGAVLAVHRRFRLAAIVGAAAAAPLLAFAALSVARGFYPLPNSVLLKGAQFDVSTPAGVIEALGGRSLRMLAQAPHLLALVLACLALLAWGGATRRALPALAVVTTLLHLQFADTGWLYRYEAYLVALGLLALGVAAPGATAALRGATTRGGRAASLAAACLAAVLAYPLVERAIRAAAETPRAAKNIFDQQYQLGLFLGRFYSGRAVAANDIGAVSYLADVKLLDLYGLASMEVARARRAGTLDAATLSRLTSAQGTEVVAVYRSWFAQSLPAEWQEAGSWRAPEKVVVADRVVTFYARDDAARASLTESLRAFAAGMPADVVVRLPEAGAP
jgi:hypothetical protein